VTYWILAHWWLIAIVAWVGLICAMCWWAGPGCDRVLIWWDRRKWKAGR